MMALFDVLLQRLSQLRRYFGFNFLLNELAVSLLLLQEIPRRTQLFKLFLLSQLLLLLNVEMRFV